MTATAEKKAPAKKAPAAKKVAATAAPPAAKPVKKAPAAKAPAAKPVTEKAPREKKTGLRKPQVTLLQTAKKAGKPLSRKELAEKGGVDSAMCTEYIGSEKDDVRLKNDEKHFPSLVTLGYLKPDVEVREEREVRVFTITAKGAKALEDAIATEKTAK